MFRMQKPWILDNKLYGNVGDTFPVKNEWNNYEENNIEIFLHWNCFALNVCDSFFWHSFPKYGCFVSALNTCLGWYSPFTIGFKNLLDLLLLVCQRFSFFDTSVIEWLAQVNKSTFWHLKAPMWMRTVRFFC